MATSEEVNDIPSPIKDFMLSYLMPEKCYDNFFVNFNVTHVPCLKIVLSKTVGLWILLGTVLAQLPQVLKLMRGRSGEGLSLMSVLLQLYSTSGPVVYCVANNFPLSAWGERLFMLIQTATIGFLILHYRGNTLKVMIYAITSTLNATPPDSTTNCTSGMLFLLAYGGVMFLLGSSAPTAVISMMQASSVRALIASKVIQAGTNYSNGHTGQLSSISVLLVWAGSLALIFASLLETGKSLSTLAHVLSACLSCILLAQVLCYRKSSAAIKDKSE